LSYWHQSPTLAKNRMKLWQELPHCKNYLSTNL
jgi:hypothetical protein